MTPAIDAARVLVQSLAALGVRDVVLAPGSRSAPLALALADAARVDDRPAGAPVLRLHVRIDERSAGFLALGLARAAAAAEPPGTPVAVVTTSGTAVANLHPAVLEAHHSGLPLLVLSADRPHELRGTGANQTTEQPGIFGTAVRLAFDVPAPTGLPSEARDLRSVVARAVAAATGSRTGAPGPVHLNLAYREPLIPTDDEAWPAAGSAGLTVVEPRWAGERPVAAASAAASAVVSAVSSPSPSASSSASSTTATGAVPVVAPPAPSDPARRRRGRRTQPAVVVAGDGAGPAARRLAESTGWPLLAEPSSGARGGPQAVTAYRHLLDDERLGGAIRRVVVLGRPTLSRQVSRLLADPDVEVVVVAPRGAPWPDAARNAAEVLLDVPAGLRRVGSPEGWTETWRAADAAARAALDKLFDVTPGAPGTRRSRSAARVTGPALARAVAQVSEPSDVIVVGSSSPARDLDLVAAWDAPPLVVANRGLAGIDGLVSTATGVAFGLPDRRVRAYLGDLSFLHDAGGLLHGPAEPPADLQVVVANDDGGSIFSTLEPGGLDDAATFERVFGTPHGADLAALCAGYGVRHTRVADVDGLLPALASPGPGVSVVEVRVDRAGRRALGDRVAAEISAAVSAALG
ncbi:MAG TPA: 2-succinyl-5-enolpyruvyl-6-hydroxy-3-cyclohexene-1-carboxylic-acid synthase [Cellulomonas sp.]